MKPQTPTPDQQKANLIEPELQHNIPVKQHLVEDIKAPVNAIKQFVEHDNKNKEVDEATLKDVNKTVKEEDKKNKSKKPLFSFRKKQTAPKPEAAPAPQLVKPAQKNPQKASKTSKPTLVVVSAVIAAAVLSVAAFYAFTPKKDSQQSQINSANTNTAAATSAQDENSQTQKVTAADLSKDSSDLNSRIDSLNDTQDFNINDLSDSALGLQQ